MNTKNAQLVIIGGGAAGLVSAIAAARALANTGIQVTILEKHDRLGKTILATGNGRCNLTNENISAKHGFAAYRNHEFAAPTLERYDFAEVSRFFSGLGLLTSIDYQGWVFPYSKTANSVLDVLLNEVSRLGIELVFAAEVKNIQSLSPETPDLPKMLGLSGASAPPEVSGSLETSALPDSTGSLDSTAPPKTSGLSEGFKLALGNGIFVHAATVVVANAPSDIARTLKRQPFVEPTPVLSALETSTNPIKGLDGVRCNCKATLYRKNKAVSAESGEILFRPYGVSGIAVFNLSRFANRGDDLLLDFLPAYSQEELLAFLRQRLITFKANLAANLVTNSATNLVTNPAANLVTNPVGLSARDFLVGLLHRRLILAVIKAAGLAPDAPVDEKNLMPIAKELKGFALSVRGVSAQMQPQLMRGGLATEGFDPTRLESRSYPGLFAAGEALDVDGPCGGFNLHWAWASGLVAGENAAQRAKKFSNVRSKN